MISELKHRLAELRQRVADDGSHFPACEVVIQEFWDYDDADREKARVISHQYLQRRLDELAEEKRNVQTWKGNPPKP